MENPSNKPGGSDDNPLAQELPIDAYQKYRRLKVLKIIRAIVIGLPVAAILFIILFVVYARLPKPQSWGDVTVRLFQVNDFRRTPGNATFKLEITTAKGVAECKTVTVGDDTQKNERNVDTARNGEELLINLKNVYSSSGVECGSDLITYPQTIPDFENSTRTIRINEGDIQEVLEITSKGSQITLKELAHAPFVKDVYKLGTFTRIPPILTYVQFPIQFSSQLHRFFNSEDTIGTPAFVS